MAATGTYNHSALLQKQRSFGASYISKPDESVLVEGSTINNSTKQKNETLGWICCAPCIWLRTSTTVHKIAITAATFLVTSLLVASPILFLISTAPSRLPRECFSTDDECNPTPSPTPECSETICKLVSTNIQAKVNWNLDPCSDFKNFCCSHNLRSESTLALQSIQGAVDIQMQINAMIQNAHILRFHNLNVGLTLNMNGSLTKTSVSQNW
ncbi:uncharacterized protein LOC118749915 isoform X1 [Rhagoletis pomonella]|uniref:uncharacterized protein LOC118749915 isoform X1 n=1 Tax=Rhagoletis pomonella TaxID=28610 RepID=UPI0017850A5E|nr:uncharacterized protein LOC118749915 isoform X1 [Rhagoletis pomonella]